MLHRTLSALLSFLFVCGCSTSAPSNESPSCGAQINPDRVLVVDAEKLFADQGLDVVIEYATEQAGPFQLISTSTFRSGTFPKIANEPHWIHGQEAAASKGCDILILVESKMLRLADDGRPSRYLYFLMGLRMPRH